MVHLLASEVQQLLHNKFVVILGDSVQRAVYKDLVLLLQKDCLLTYKQLSAKGELTFEKDHLVEGGQLDELHNGTHYREVREFCSDHHLVRFYFLTRVYSPYLQNILQELWSDNEQGPDVVIMNSCLWDISRYGPNSWRSYRKNLENLFGCLGQMLPKSCLLVWNTAMPLGDRIKARFLPKKGEYRPTITTLKKNLLRANFYSCVEARKHFFDVLDLHFHFRHARMHLQGDGVHWNEHAHRQLSQLLLAHVADAWGVELPCRDPVVSYSEYDPADAEWEGGEWEESGQVEDLYPPSKGGLQGVGQCLPQPPHNPLPLRPSLRPPPLLPLPPPLHHVRHPPPPYAQDNYFTSDHTFQSDQFYIHSDAPPPTHTGYAFKGDFRFGSQPPMPNFHPHCYQRRAPVVHRGYPRYLAPGPYVSWRGRPRRSQRSTPASLESRPQ